MQDLSPDPSSTPIYLQIVSNTPGRLRLRVSRQNQDNEKIIHMAGSLKDFFPQIDNVKINSQTGSITIYYSVENGNFEEALSQLEYFGIFIVDLPQEKSPSAKLTKTVYSLRDKVKQVTKNQVDLRIIVPFIVVVIVVKRLLPQLARWKTTVLYLLLWYALESLIQQYDQEKSPNQ
jgi:Heavy metal associated domain 2